MTENDIEKAVTEAPTFFFPVLWAKGDPKVWAWVEENALSYEYDYSRDGWKVWMPAQGEDK